MDNSRLKSEQNRDQFKSKIGFVLAAAGSAVGLGNIWKFPYVTGRNGGGAFVLIYLISIIIIGASIVLVEFVIGRNGKSSAVECYGKFNKKFKFAGYLSMIAVTVLLSYYAVIGGWTLCYFVQAISGKLIGLSPEKLGAGFNSFVNNPSQLAIYQILFLVVTAFVIIKGISGGIEKCCSILMPGLFVMLIFLTVRSITLPGAMRGVIWFLKPDFSKVNGSTVVNAVGQAFFSLSLGSGGMVTYASYLNRKENLPQAALATTVADTSVAILSGLAILPAVFAFEFEVDSGPSLAFITLPNVFSKIPFGTFFAIIFFGLLFFAALTSSLAMLEVSVTYVVEKTKLNRVKAASIITALIFFIGIPPLMSFGGWSHIQLAGKNIFDIYDYFVSNISFPLVGLMGALVIGYVWKKEDVIVEVTNNGKHKFKLLNVWYFLVKYIIPIILVGIFLRAIGILKI